MNPMADIRKSPLPPLEDLAEGVAVRTKARIGAQKGPRHSLARIGNIPGLIPWRSPHMGTRLAPEHAPRSKRSDVHRAYTRPLKGQRQLYYPSRQQRKLLWQFHVKTSSSSASRTSKPGDSEYTHMPQQEGSKTIAHKARG